MMYILCIYIYIYITNHNYLGLSENGGYPVGYPQSTISNFGVPDFQQAHVGKLMFSILNHQTW
jgi:hypothetical protein